MEPLKSWLAMAYEPIVAVAADGSHRTIAYEALARICNSRGDVYLPEEFLPRFEPLSVEFGWFTRATLKLAMNAAYVLPVPVWVNVLPRADVCTPALVEWCEELLGRIPIDASRLCFELVENGEISESVCETLKQLVRMGFSIAVDDFGNGNSAAYWEHEALFSYMKIPRERLGDHEFIEQVVGGFARSRPVVVEGIESGVQLAQLRARFAAETVWFQGRYFGGAKFAHELVPGILPYRA